MGRLIKAMAICRPEARSAAGLRDREHEPTWLQAASLSALAGIRHGFFTREGGVSDGIYASLNGGIGSDDAPAKVAENRARMAAALGVRPDRFLTAYQIHSPDVVTIERAVAAERAARAPMRS